MTFWSILGADAQVSGDTEARVAQVIWAGVQVPRRKEMEDMMMCLGVANRSRSN